MGIKFVHLKTLGGSNEITTMVLWQSIFLVYKINIISPKKIILPPSFEATNHFICKSPAMAATVGAEQDQELMDPPAAAVDPKTVNDMEIDEKTPTNSPSKSSSPDPLESPPPPPVLAVKHQSRINSEEEDMWKVTSRKLFEESPHALPPPTAIPAAGAEESKESVELRGWKPDEMAGA